MSGLLPVVVVGVLGALAFGLGKKKAKRSSSSTSTTPTGETILVRGSARSEHGGLGRVDFELVKVAGGRFIARWNIPAVPQKGVTDPLSTDSAAFLEMATTLELAAEPPFDVVEESDGFSGTWGTKVHYVLTRDVNGLWGWNANRTGELTFEGGRYPFTFLPSFASAEAARNNMLTELALVSQAGLGSAGGLHTASGPQSSPSPGPGAPAVVTVTEPSDPGAFATIRYPNEQGVPLPPMQRADGIVFSADCRVVGVGPMFWERTGDEVERMVGQGYTSEEILLALDEQLFANIDLSACMGPRLLRNEITERVTDFMQGS